MTERLLPYVQPDEVSERERLLDQFVVDETTTLLPVHHGENETTHAIDHTLHGQKPDAEPRTSRRAILGLMAGVATAALAGKNFLLPSAEQASLEPAALSVFDAIDALPVVNVESIDTQVIIKPPKANVLPKGEKDIVAIIEKASNPEIEAAQLVDMIARTHGIKGDRVTGDESASAFTMEKGDDIEDIMFIKNVSVKDATIIKSSLAYATAIAMYPEIVPRLTAPERKTLQDLMSLGDKKEMRAITDQMRQLLDAAVSQDEKPYPEQAQRYIASFLAVAQTIVDRKQLPRPKPSASEATPDATSPERYVNHSTFYRPTKGDIKELLPQSKDSIFDKQYDCIMKELHIQGLDKDPKVLAYIFATISVENPQFNSGISEYGGETYLRGKDYYPYFGRGLTQLTWAYNYIKYGKLIGINIFKNPSLVNKPEIDAKVLAMFMKRHVGRKRVRESIESGNLRVARRGYNGGSNGLRRVREAFHKAVPMFEKRAVTPFPTPQLELKNNHHVPTDWIRPESATDCDPQDEKGFTYNTKQVAKAITDKFGIKSFGGVIAPDEKKYGHSEDSDHYTGHALDVMLDGRKDWNNFKTQEQLANWLIEHAVELNVHYIIVGHKIWNIEHRDKGWREYTVGTTKPTNESEYTTAHYKHVHVSVYESNVKGFSPMNPDGEFHTIIGKDC